MPLSKARQAAAMRNHRLLKSGVQPSYAQIVEVMSPNQRKERLAELIAVPIVPEKVNAAHIIAAIDIYNKMDKIYSDIPAPTNINVVFIIGKGYLLEEHNAVKQIKGTEGCC